MKTDIQKLFLVLCTLGVTIMTMRNTALAEQAVLKLGYVPTTFPRDVIEVNQFAEHAILGQILEPLVDADRFGNMTPGLAESWTVSKDGKTLKFKLMKGRTFSNGRIITAKDVVYSISRHLKNQKSQSNNFINSIDSIKAESDLDLVISLKEANVAILKALTRDHLGVLPEGWSFDQRSDEPFIGSAPYRLVRERGNWFLVINEKSPIKNRVSVTKWQLIFLGTKGTGVLGADIPDYVPLASQLVKMDLEKELNESHIKAQFKEQLSFVQTSLWWYPHGAHYRTNKVKKAAMAFLRELVETYCAKTKYQRATGIVPLGIAGYLPEQVKIPLSSARLKKPITLKIAGMNNLFDEMFRDKNANHIAVKYNIKFEYFTFTPADLKNLQAKKPDIVMGSWAGGFNDPEGFLPLLNQLLATNFFTYLDDIAPLYHKARVEQDWTKRSQLFREFNERLVLEERMVPGWKIPMYSMTRSNLQEEEIGFRYTPRLINVRKQE